MARLILTEDEAAICQAVGVRSFTAARKVVGEVVDARWAEPMRRASGRIRGGMSRVQATLVIGPDGAVKSIDGACACKRSPECDHPVALVLAAGFEVAESQAAARPWESALAWLTDAEPAEPEAPEIALQFELETTGTTRVLLRPVLPGRNGWVRTGINWQTLGHTFYSRSGRTARHLALLQELRGQTASSSPYSYYSSYADSRVINLGDFPARRVWDLLLEAQDEGLPLVSAGRAAEPVTVRPAPVRYSVQVDRDGDDLRLRPALTDGRTVLDPRRTLLVGEPAHGVAWWEDGPRVLRLASLARPVTRDAAAALASPSIVVPGAEQPRFLRQFYPGLARRAEVVVLDESVRLPDLSRATLTLTGRRLPDHRMTVSWSWVTTIGDGEHREPLDDVALTPAHERTLDSVTEVVADPRYGLTEPSPDGPRLLAGAVVSGDAMLHLIRDLTPALTALPDVEVELHTDQDYVETVEAPVISFAETANGDSDWFDLAVEVTVGGEQVGFQDLFVALAAEQEFLILPSGRYFSLDRTEFRQLRDLIAEARALQDAPPGTVRVGRFQAGVWQELAEIGELSGPAAAWQESIRALSETGTGPRAALPDGLSATLRGYQEEGFQWLAALHRHRLGGVLADDMGLGKTVQTLALICHAVEEGTADAPFLVVAPASVVGNWVSEATRFAPGLDVRAVQQTQARRPGTLAETVGGAHVVVTSYTLFRLEHDEYAALPWAGLILDEAQFVKNAASQAYRCARQLPAPFKLAITGTPMENNLAELWALLSITAPGLLSRLDRFTEFYRRPIEREQDQERLAHLRRRIRPLMLRRRKAEVVADLPAKQEQTVMLELNPRHRKIYQTYLQRERQKVLGLLGDLQQNRFEIFRSLTLLRQASLDLSLVDAKHHAVPSTKLDALVERVTDLAAEGHRTLVFSQFTRFLTAARERLENDGIECHYLDGKTTDRARVIDAFKSGTAPVFLISLKSGGFGLNLTEADYCIMLDPWWNPATEAQAVDRIHRIGQTRNVMVYRLVAKDTIEEKVMALQAKKAALFGSVLDGGDFASTTLTAADIQTLLE
ncbi:superfamily II DNA or RNA helicase [Catenuloplanes nepalensis]|uniref:Superfamily II DNA or RNA helicase n=1 Tax=Catenuloplanes nepalensis TaxID=587533 RepID=A0ABT9N7N1_9ACTN|nr:DEAD/DEAH box helicase [Catenuloplanes nepalensis]MDP9799709.1 superfamily II DNA or RNA helicase [Catenuloplanes nepalensis]